MTVEDSNGNPVTTDNTDPVTLAITGGTGTSGAILSCTGSLTATAASGVASFSGCAVDKVGTGYTLTAMSSSLTSATSNTFNITPGTAAQLAFTTRPVSSQSGSTVPVAVAVQDSNGSTVTTSSRTVNLAITGGTGTSGATLSCSGTKAFSGVATFGGCAIDKAGAGYTLTATSGSLTPATSNTFTITAGTASAVNIVSGNNQSATVSTAFAVPLTAIVTDANGNPVSGASVTFQAVPASGGASATFAAKGCSSTTKSPACVVTTKSDGQATTSTFTANGISGSYTIVATTPVGANPPSATFNEANNF